MPENVGIVRGNFGRTYRIVVKNVDYSTKDGRLYVQSSGGTLLLEAGICTTTATDSSKNTLVEYAPASGVFGLAASGDIDYWARVEFSGGGILDSTEKFLWYVEDELRG